MKKHLIVAITVYSSLFGFSQTWKQVGSEIYGTASGDNLGYSVSVSKDGGTIAAGAIYNSGSEAGYIKVYQRTGSSWIQKGGDIVGFSGIDHCGYSTSLNLDGSIIAVSSPYANIGAGKVQIYEWDGSSWVQKGISVNGENGSDFFGSSVDINGSGNIFIAGAYDLGTGYIKAYEWDGSSWTQKGSNILSLNSEYIGTPISIDKTGDNIAVGYYQFNGGTTVNKALLKVFKWNGSSWQQHGEIIKGNNSQDNFGWSTGISGDGQIIISGAINNDGSGTDSGSITVFEKCDLLNNPTPVLSSLIDVIGECEVNSLIAPTAKDDCGGIISGTQTASLPIKQNTTVVWTYEDLKGNKTTQNQNIIINCTTETAEYIKTKKYASPNPFNDKLTIEGAEINSEYTITDYLGKTVLKGKIEHNTQALNMGSLPQGVYVLKMNESKIKLIKN